MPEGFVHFCHCAVLRRGRSSVFIWWSDRAALASLSLMSATILSESSELFQCVYAAAQTSTIARVYQLEKLLAVAAYKSQSH